MKHLKYINELRVSTYRNAARGLRKFGHNQRADDLEFYSDEVEEVRTQENLEKLRKIYSKFGEVSVSIDSEVYRGYLLLYPVIGFFTEYYDEFRDYSSEIEFFVESWFIPHEDEKDIFNSIDQTSLGENYNLEQLVQEGLLPLKNFTFKITKDAEVAKVSKTSVNNHFSWEDERIPIHFTNRRSAMFYKKALKNIFTGDIYYPLYRTEKDTFDHVNQKIFNNTGLRNDFGLTIDKLAIAVQKHSINTLYESN